MINNLPVADHLFLYNPTAQLFTVTAYGNRTNGLRLLILEAVSARTLKTTSKNDEKYNTCTI